MTQKSNGLEYIGVDRDYFIKAPTKKTIAIDNMHLVELHQRIADRNFHAWIDEIEMRDIEPIFG